MEFLYGGTLRDRLLNGPLDQGEAAAIAADVCSALSYAHASAIIHRDIKPGNILFSETGHTKVADFGIAKAAFAPTNLTDTGAVLGTVRYLAPEQIEGLEPDSRADLYSLAVVLYEAITGRPPFTGENDLAMATARLTTSPKPPRDLRPDLPRDLEAVVMRGLARDRDMRFQDADSFGRALSPLIPGAAFEEAAAGLSSPVTQETAVASFVKSERRWILPAVLVIAIAAALVIAFPSVKKVLTPKSGDSEKATALVIQEAGAYDPPPGNGKENNNSLGNAFDGDGKSAWKTEGYANALMGGLKDGVGIYFDLGESKPLSVIEVLTDTPGWEASIRSSDDAESWADPSPPQTVGSQHRFEVSGSHRYWMIWITSLVRTGGKNPFSASINEVRILPA
jgi:serine/threonine protein kinase